MLRRFTFVIYSVKMEREVSGMNAKLKDKKMDALFEAILGLKTVDEC